MKVTGIGGVFFRAKDPAVLSDWYKKHLGINGMEWAQQQGQTVFAPFPADSEYFGSESQNFMLNFRVNDLDSMLNQLALRTQTGQKLSKTRPAGSSNTCW